MLPVDYGGHSAFQNIFVSEFLNLFPDPFAVPKHTWDIIVKFWYLDLSETDSIMLEFYSPAWKTRYTFPVLPASFLSPVYRIERRFHYRMVQAA